MTAACGGLRRRRLASASYEGAAKHSIEQHPLAVYDRSTRTDDVARRVALSQTCDSAFYVMEVSSVEARVREWRQLLPSVSPFYALSCNADPILLQLLVNFHYMNLHVSNVAELEMALQLVPPSRIQFHAPLLTRKTLRLVCSLPALHSLVVDSEECLQSASALSPSLPLLLRVSLDPDSDRADRAIGVPLHEAFFILLNAIQVGVNVVGVSLQLLSGEREESLVASLDALAALFHSLAEAGCPLSTLDIGGGFYSGKSHRLLMRRCASLIESGLGGGALRVVATPGRFFAASAFSLCTSIVGKSAIDARDITQDDVDSGSTGYVYQTNEGVYGAFGDHLLSASAASCHPLFSPSTPALHASAVLGAALDPLDVPSRRARLPSLSIGDWLLWRGMGAYSFHEGEDSLPVYYYTERKHWQRLQRRCRRRSQQHSDASSDEDSDDLAECFGRVFEDDFF